MRGLTTLGLVILTLICGICAVTSASVVTQDFTYQGVLTDSGGNLLTGTYDVSFNLYDIVETTPPWTMQRFLANDNVSVECTNGKFTTKLTFDMSYFDGRPLFLGIAVGTDPEMTPRQQITPVPYALGLRPGASIVLNDTASNLNLVNTGGGSALNITSIGSYQSGINEYIEGPVANGLNLTMTGSGSAGINLLTYGNGSRAISVDTKGKGGDGMAIFTYGEESKGIDIYTCEKNQIGIDIESYLDFSKGLRIVTIGNTSPGVDVTSAGRHSPAVYALSRESDSPAVKGVSEQDIGIYGIGKEGGRFETVGWGDTGVNVTVPGLYGTGIDVNMGDAASTGINITTRESSCRAINTTLGYGSSVGSSVTATGDAQTGMAVSLHDGTGGTAYSAVNTGDRQKGMVIDTNGVDAHGIDITTRGDNSRGLTVTTHGFGSSTGIKVMTDGSWGAPAIEASVIGGNAIVASTGSPDGRWAFYTNNGVRAGWFTSAGAGDVAEYMDATEDLPPGTVLIIGGDGRLTPSTSAYDTRVAGIISTNPGMKLGGDDGKNEGKELIAVAGRVPCKVDASYGAIHPGDLLATSDTAGYAMKAANPKIGTILGKAMGTLESGTGSIDVIVTLQ